MTNVIRRYPALSIGIPMAFVMAGADLAGGGSVFRAGLSWAIVLAYAALVTALGRRSETVSALSGRPVDERWEHLNLEACAWALAVSGTVVLGAFLIADATGSDGLPYAFMAAVIGLSYVGSLVALRLRH